MICIKWLIFSLLLIIKRMQSMTNKFITNLAVADLAVIFICVPVTVSRLIFKQWVLGPFLCRISSFVQGNLILKICKMFKFYGK
jgi:neuropeptide FF receptor 2